MFHGIYAIRTGRVVQRRQLGQGRDGASVSSSRASGYPVWRTTNRVDSCTIAQMPPVQRLLERLQELLPV